MVFASWFTKDKADGLRDIPKMQGQTHLLAHPRPFIFSTPFAWDFYPTLMFLKMWDQMKKTTSNIAQNVL
jgi:hypothetical protein